MGSTRSIGLRKCERMTGLEIAAAYATIVQLVGQFKQERKDALSVTDEEFLGWLARNHQEPIRKLIQENKELQTGIFKLLRQDNRLVMSKIDDLGAMLIGVSSMIGEFRDIFHALAPSVQMEPEVMALLKELVDKDWRKFSVMATLGGGPSLGILEGECLPFNGDSQFLFQDLDRLAALGFLDLSYLARGEKVYSLIRAAYRVIGTKPESI